jgi:glutamyl-tRNA reductase
MNADAAPIDVVKRDLGSYDIVVSSTSSPDPVLTRTQVEAALKRRDRRPLFLIDLAVPRDIESGAGGLDNVYLYNIDDLSEIASENLAQRKAEVARCQAILEERADRAWTSIRGITGGDVAGRAKFSVRPSG